MYKVFTFCFHTGDAKHSWSPRPCPVSRRTTAPATHRPGLLLAPSPSCLRLHPPVRADLSRAHAAAPPEKSQEPAGPPAGVPWPTGWRHPCSGLERRRALPRPGQAVRQRLRRTQPDGARHGVWTGARRTGATLAWPPAALGGQFALAPAQERRARGKVRLGAMRQPSRAAGTLPAGPRVGALRCAQSNRTGPAPDRFGRGRDRTGVRTLGPRPTRRRALERSRLHRLPLAGGGARSGRALRQPQLARQFRRRATTLPARRGRRERGRDLDGAPGSPGRVPRAGLAAGVGGAPGQRALEQRPTRSAGHLAAGPSGLSDGGPGGGGAKRRITGGSKGGWTWSTPAAPAWPRWRRTSRPACSWPTWRAWSLGRRKRS